MKSKTLLQDLENCLVVVERCAARNKDPLRVARYEGKVAAFKQAIGLVKIHNRK